MFIYHNYFQKLTIRFAFALQMRSQILKFSRWCSTFGKEFDRQEVKIIYTYLYIEL